LQPCVGENSVLRWIAQELFQFASLRVEQPHGAGEE
jgi:hypothetical protein